LASFTAVHGVLATLKDHFESRLEVLAGHVENPRVQILGSQDLRGDPAVNALGLYLHRLSIDPYGRNRYIPPGRPGQPPRPELPVNLHLLLVGWCRSAAAEVMLVSWAMQEIGAALELDASQLGALDADWATADRLQMIPEEMSTEDLMRVWDSLPGDYRLSSPYLVKTLRLEPVRQITQGAPVTSIVLPMETR